MIYPQRRSCPTDWPSLVRQARTVHFVIISAALLQSSTLFTLLATQSPGSAVDPVIGYALGTVGLIDFIMACVIRNVIYGKVGLVLQTNPQQPGAQRQWRAATIISTAMAYSVFLFGFVLAVLRGDRWIYVSLWSLAAVAFYLFIPHSPISETTEANSPPPAQQ